MWSLVAEYIILKSDTLEIKNFGKFTATDYDATIDTENRTLTPGGRKFAFVPVATNTTENFIQFASKRLKKSRPEIERMIEKSIFQAQETLKKGEKVELPHIGYLFAPDKENPTLIQTAQFSLQPDNFGYTEITLPFAQTKIKTEKTTIPKTEKNEKKKTETTKNIKEKEPVNINSPEILKYAAIITAIAAIIVVGIFYGQPIIDFSKGLLKPKSHQQVVTKKHSQPKVHTTKKQTTANARSQQTSKQEQTPATASTSAPQAQQPTAAQKQPSQTIPEQPSVADTAVLAKIKIKAHIPVGQGYKKYYLIVGSFIKMENAKKFKQELIAEGYPALILSFGPNRHRVSIGSYDDPSQVIKAHDDYVAKHPGKGIWLLINDQK